MEIINETEEKTNRNNDELRKHRIGGEKLDQTLFHQTNLSFVNILFDIAAVFLGTVSGMAAIAGFGRTIASARKQDQKLYEQANLETVNLIEAGTKLARRALAWGTFYAVLGTGTFFFGIWKISGAKNVHTLNLFVFV